MKRYTYFASFAGIAATALATLPASAETIKLTVVGAPPPIVTPVAVTKNFFIPEINKRLAASGKDFKIEWKQAYSQSLARFSEVFEAVEEGIAHVGVLLRNFEEAKLPLEQYTARMPFSIFDPALLNKVDSLVRQKVPQMNKTYENFNQVFLASAASVSMQMFTKFPITKFEDLKGHKIGASGSLGQYLRGTGATIVTASMNQSFTHIKSGLYEGYPIHIGLAFPYKTYEAAKIYTEVNFGANTIGALSVNKKTWDGFPVHVRKIFRDVAAKWPSVYLNLDKKKIGKFTGIMKKKGVKFSKLSEAERSRWANQLPNLAGEWIKALEPKGIAVRAVVTTFMDEVRKVNPNVIRHWDR